MIVKLSPAIACSTRAFASASGKEIPDGRRNETKTNRLAPAAFAASTRCSCPASSTVSIESPTCRERVEDAVEITASTPRHAPASEPVSFRSPTNTSTPHPRKDSTFSLELVGRTSALTFSPWLASRRQISLPTMPVEPTTRTMSALLKDIAYACSCGKCCKNGFLETSGHAPLAGTRQGQGTQKQTLQAARSHIHGLFVIRDSEPATQSCPAGHRAS